MVSSVDDDPMFLTTVREQRADDPIRAAVVIGTPVRRIHRADAAVDSQFEPGAIVAYRVRLLSRDRLFVFRTLRALTRADCTKVPGVEPRVQLLLSAHTARRIHRALRILHGARSRGRELGTLSDAFFLRAATTLASRAPIDSVVTTLLQQEPDHGLAEYRCHMQLAR